MPITISVPFFDPHVRFLPDFIEWYALNKVKHDLNKSWSTRKALHHALTRAVIKARRRKSSHILFVEDDHWGFPVDGLDTLLAEDKDVIGFMTMSRRYPYHALCMNRIDADLPITQMRIENMRPFERTTNPANEPEAKVSQKVKLLHTSTIVGEWGGYLVPYNENTMTQEPVGVYQPIVHECDLLSWAFTLVKMEVFDAIEDPFTNWGQAPNDSQFCENCDKVGIQRFVHFGYAIPHDEVTYENRHLLRQVETVKRNYYKQRADT